MLPDFLIIGAAKSGTSALYDILVRHPGVFGSPIKEPNFFALEGARADFQGPGDDDTVNRLSVTDRSAYECLFDGAPEGTITFEASTMYLSSGVASRTIRRMAPDTRLVCILREPIARAFSSFLHLVRDGREPASSFSEALDDEPQRIAAHWEPLWHYSRLSCYHTHLQRYFEVFPEEQIHLVAYDDFREAPAAAVTGILDFLGLETSVDLDFGTRVNVSGTPRSRFLQHLLVRENLPKRLIRKALPQRVRHRMWNRLSSLNVTSRKPQMDPSDVVRLAERFEPEVDALEQLWGRDLSRWRESWSGRLLHLGGDGQTSDPGSNG